MNNNNYTTIILKPDMLPISVRTYAKRKCMDVREVLDLIREGELPAFKAGNGVIFINQAVLVMREAEAEELRPACIASHSNTTELSGELKGAFDNER